MTALIGVCAVIRSNTVIQTNNTGEISTESENAGNKCTFFKAWDKLDAYARNLNRLVIRVPGDGHCLLHAVRRSLAVKKISRTFRMIRLFQTEK